MSFTICAFNHENWTGHGLADFADFANKITEINVGEDSFSGYGEWFYVPDEPLPNGDFVIYYGSWGNDNSPGASMYTHATIFDGNDPTTTRPIEGHRLLGCGDERHNRGR
jgi:hypothetical protein